LFNAELSTTQFRLQSPSPILIPRTELHTSDLQKLAGEPTAELNNEFRELADHGQEVTALDYLLAKSASPPHSVFRSLFFQLLRIYGSENSGLEDQLQRLSSMCAQFVALYGHGPVAVLRVPARINLLGEHIDYVSYLPTASLPFGSREHDMLMLYRPSDTDRVRGASSLAEYPPFEFSFGEGPAPDTSGDAESRWLDYLYEHPTPSPGWGNYIKASVFFARIKYGAQIRHGFDFVVDSQIPAGGGASSSSALVVLASAARPCKCLNGDAVTNHLHPGITPAVLPK